MSHFGFVNDCKASETKLVLFLLIWLKWNNQTKRLQAGQVCLAVCKLNCLIV